jgi:hypothetical protein
LWEEYYKRHILYEQGLGPFARFLQESSIVTYYRKKLRNRRVIKLRMELRKEERNHSLIGMTWSMSSYCILP